MRIFLLLLFFGTSIFANHVRYTTNYDMALDRGIKQDKIVMVMVALKGCPVCEYMTDRVFENKKIVSYLHEHYVTVIKYIHRDKIPKRFDTENAPTFFFIDPKNEKELRKPKLGGANEEKFMEVIEEVKEIHDSQTLHNQFDTIIQQERNTTGEIDEKNSTIHSAL